MWLYGGKLLRTLPKEKAAEIWGPNGLINI